MELVTLPVKRIVASKDNPRTVNEKSATFAELTESVRAHGVIVPVHVRVHPTRKDKYELLAGERRLRACQAARVNEIRAVDHGLLSDSEAFEITFAENFCREDLSVLEEGKAAAVLLDKYAGDAKSVAAKLGRSERWVLLRAAIDANLAPCWRTLIGHTEDFAQWTAAHLARIARFPANVQEALAKRVNKGWPWNQCHGWSVAELDKYCAEELMLLAKAPFDTSPDSKCAKCPKRTSVQPALWADKQADAIKANDRCLDRKCWLKRDASACKRLLAEKQAKYPELICVSNATFHNEDKTKLKRCYGNFLSQGSFEICKKADKGAKPALVIAGRDKGKVRYVKTQPAPKPARQRKPSTKEQKALQERQRWYQVASRFADRLEKIPYAEVPGSKASNVSLVASFCGASELYPPQAREFRQTLEKATKQGPANTLDCILERLWVSVQDGLKYQGFSGSEDDRENMKLIAVAFGIDLAAMYDDVVAEEEDKGKDAENQHKAA